MVGAVFRVVYMLGLNLAAIIAGLGVGGIAMALAAQKTLENFLGGITVVSGKTVRVGDFCRAGDYLGTVQAVGMRCTRIRTLDRTLASIPNGQLALMNIENLTKLDLEIFAYVLDTKYEAFTHIQEDLLLCIIDIVEAGGSGFAFPSQTPYLAQDSCMDAAKSRKAEETVRQWREQGELPFGDQLLKPG